MKKQLLLILVMTLLPMISFADVAKINGLWYNLVSQTKQAEVILYIGTEYSGNKRGLETVPLSMDIDLFNTQADDTRQIGLLRDRIRRLGAFDRAIVLLWLEDMSYEEIGQIVGITSNNVSVRLVRIKEQLKNMQ